MSDTIAVPRAETYVTGVAARQAAAPGRLRSLDIFRGMTVAGMLLVNNPGTWSTIYDPLEHAAWHGWTPTDLIFPFFLFIVGVSMTFSFDAQRAKGASAGRAWMRAAKRAAVLFALGLLLAAFPYYTLDLAHLRIMGVLQRIGLAFLLASTVVLFTPLRAQAAVAAALLLGYWAAMTRVDVPGFGAGDLSKEGNLAAYVDRAILGTDHLWASAKTWDPEGLLSTLPAVATVLLGVFAGRWIRGERTPAERAVGMFFAGNVLLAGGLAWGAAFPINKNLWTSSYVLFTAGFALNVLAMVYWTVDVRGTTWWTRPFTVLGTNAIAAFFLSGVMARLLTLVPVPGGAEGTRPLKSAIFARGFEPWLPAHDASLAFALCFVLFWVGMMEILDRREIFIKV